MSTITKVETNSDVNSYAVTELKKIASSSQNKHNVDVLLAVIKALGEAGGKEAIDILIKIRKTSDIVNVQLSAIEAIGRAGRIN